MYSQVYLWLSLELWTTEWPKEGGVQVLAVARSRSSGPLGALLSSPALDVRLLTALQVLQVKSSMSHSTLARQGSRARTLAPTRKRSTSYLGDGDRRDGEEGEGEGVADSACWGGHAGQGGCGRAARAASLRQVGAGKTPGSQKVGNRDPAWQLCTVCIFSLRRKKPKT